MAVDIGVSWRAMFFVWGMVVLACIVTSIATMAANGATLGPFGLDSLITGVAATSAATAICWFFGRKPRQVGEEVREVPA